MERYRRGNSKKGEKIRKERSFLLSLFIFSPPSHLLSSAFFLLYIPHLSLFAMHVQFHHRSVTEDAKCHRRCAVKQKVEYWFTCALSKQKCIMNFMKCDVDAAKSREYTTQYTRLNSVLILFQESLAQETCLTNFQKDLGKLYINGLVLQKYK